MAASNFKKGAGVSTVLAALVSAIFAVEGGFTTDRNDRGNWSTGVIGQGELKGTNHGISAMSYPTLDIKNLTQEEATDLYIRDFINKPGYTAIVELSPAVGHKLVDAGVNVGPARSSRWFQTALNSVSRGGKDYPQIYVDGRVGPNTATTYKHLQRVRGKVLACELIIKMLDAQQTVYYMDLAHLNVYTPGWVSHRIGNVSLSRCKE